MRLYLGLARDIVVRRTIERNERERIAGDLYDYDVVVKYAIENFKNAPVTLDVTEDVRRVRAEIGRANTRDPQWELGGSHTLGEPDAEKSDAEHLLFHASLPAREGATAAKQVVHRLHLILRNEW
jgi:hypothetical protein